MTEVKLITREDVKLPDRTYVTNKGDCGKLLIVGGGRGMAGAPSFSAEAAYRSGVGLVEVLTHGDNRIPLQILIPEAVVSFWDEWDIKRLKSYSALVIGVGMGKDDTSRRLLSRLLERVKVPTVLDADALNIISDMTELKEQLGENTVLTPHLMEFSRLTGLDINTIKEDPLNHAREFCKRYGTNLVLKNKTTHIVLSDGSAFVNTTGDSTLSKGGSGDILAGLTGSLLAQKIPMRDALCTAVFLHGKAGERAGEKFGQRGALARDVILSLAEEIRQF